MSENGIPRAPRGLGKGSEGWRLWRSVVTEWDLEDWQLHVLEAACRTANDVAEAEAIVARDGRTVPSAHGESVKAHPLLAEVRSGRAALARLLRELALRDDEDARLPR